MVSIFLQCTQKELIDALLLRYQPLHKENDRQVGQGYYHYPKKEKKKSRYITEPLPQLIDMQERILFNVQGIQERQKMIKETVVSYAKTIEDYIDYTHWFTTRKTSKNTVGNLLRDHTDEAGIWFYESPLEKTKLHVRHSPSPYFIHLDIEKAYPSLSEERLYYKLLEIFNDQRNIVPFDTATLREFQKSVALMTHLLTYDNHLATGSPASPYLFHTTLANLDEEIFAALNGFPLLGTTYTRYLDDLIISFSHIDTPSFHEFSKLYNWLWQIYDDLLTDDDKLIFEKDIIHLPMLLRFLQKFFVADTLEFSDDSWKDQIKEMLLKMRELLSSLKSVFQSLTIFYKDKIQNPSESDYQDIDDFFYILYETYHRISQNINKSLHDTIGILDRYKRLIDKQEAQYPLDIEDISRTLQKVIRNDWRKVNRAKIETRTPRSPTIKRMLWLGITKDGIITVPREAIEEKIAFYRKILLWEMPAPRNLTHIETGWIDHWKVFVSIQGYKKYIVKVKAINPSMPTSRVMRTMKFIFSKKEREAFRKIEMMCLDRFGISLKEAYDLLWTQDKQKPASSGNNHPPFINENDIPVDDRDIPWELAEYNKLWLESQEFYDYCDLIGYYDFIDENNTPLDERDIPWEDAAENQVGEDERPSTRQEHEKMVNNKQGCDIDLNTYSIYNGYRHGLSGDNNDSGDDIPF